MPPKLALLFCSVFVFALLVIENKRFKPQSLSSWIPTLWLMYCASKPLAAWFQTRAVSYWNPDASAGSPYDRLFLTVLIGIGVLILARRKIDWPRIVANNKWLFILFLYMLVSISWSDYPFVSFKRWIKASGGIVMAMIILTEPSPLKNIEMVLRRTIYILIPFSIMLAKYFPKYGVEFGRYSGIPMWVGVTSGKNPLGVLCMISILFLIWDWVNRRKQMKQHPTSYYKYEMIGQFIVLVLSYFLLLHKGYSATSVSVLILGLIILFTLRVLKTRPDFRSLIFPSSIVVSIAILLIWGIYSLNPIEAVISLTGRDATLTGRVDGIWTPLFAIAMKQPIFGVGFGGFWVEYMVFPKMVINEAHNGYLDVFLEIGIVGLILLLILIFDFLRKAIIRFQYDMEWGSLQITFLLMSLIHNITESSFLRPALFIWNILLVIMIGSLSQKITVTKEYISN